MINLNYLNSFFYGKPNFKLKIDPKTCTFKILEEIQKTSLKPAATFP